MLGDQRNQRRIGLAVFRWRGNTGFQIGFAVRAGFYTVNRVTPAFRRQPHEEDKPVRFNAERLVHPMNMGAIDVHISWRMK